MSDGQGSGTVRGSVGQPDPDTDAGTDKDVRALVPRLPAEPDGVPWGRFHDAYGPADAILGRLAELGSTDPAVAGGALRHLWSTVYHQGTVFAPAALASPYLLRLTARPGTFHRPDVLGLVAACARGANWADRCEKGVFWLTDGAQGGWACDCSGYPANWSIEGVQGAIADAGPALESLLEEPDDDVRIMAAYTLAMASSPSPTTALRRRLETEPVAVVAASLVLSAGQLAFRHGQRAAPWLDALLQDAARPAEVRIAAVLARLCFEEARPAPEVLRPVLEGLLDDGMLRTLDDLPWLGHVGLEGGGLRHYVRYVFEPAYELPPSLGSEPPF